MNIKELTKIADDFLKESSHGDRVKLLRDANDIEIKCGSCDENFSNWENSD